jgi:hypothetical protein
MALSPDGSVIIRNLWEDISMFRRSFLVISSAALVLAACSSLPRADFVPSVEPAQLRLMGLYQVCDPAGRTFSIEAPKATLSAALAGKVETVSIIALFKGWESDEQARQDITKFLSDPDLEASPSALFQLDFPLDVVAALDYEDGSRGVLAASLGKVCLRNRNGKAWYLQWEERFNVP